MKRFSFYRRRKGALAAEYMATMYLLFMFLFFPVLNLAVVTINAFFLWFACNAGAQMGAKSPCYNTLIYIPAPSGTPYPGAYQTARARANQIKNMFPGINWDTGQFPTVCIIMEPIDTSGTASRIVKPSGVSLGAGDPAPDQNIYTMLIQVSIVGTAAPLIEVPWFDVPGLSRPMTLRVVSQAQFENPPGLKY